MTQITKNPHLDPRLKAVWENGYAAGSAACIQKDEEMSRLNKELNNLGAEWNLQKEEIARLKEQLKTVLHWYNEMGHGRATMNYDVYTNAKSLLV